MSDKPETKPCPRCHGRILTDFASGDFVCFNCGHIIYAVEPLPPKTRGQVVRKPSHGGFALS